MENDWEFVDAGGDLTHYNCGLSAGDKITLLEDLAMRTNGKLNGKVVVAGEIWVVLPGNRRDPGIVWLRDPTGSRHTWDDESILERFCRLDVSG